MLGISSALYRSFRCVFPFLWLSKSGCYSTPDGLHYYFLKRCALTNKAVGTILWDFAIPLQRKQYSISLVPVTTITDRPKSVRSPSDLVLSHSFLKFLLVYGLLLKLTWTVIYYYRRQPYFFLTNFYLKQGIGSVYVMVDFICMGFLQPQGAEARFTKWKIILAHSGTRTHDLWIAKPSP